MSSETESYTEKPRFTLPIQLKKEAAHLQFIKQCAAKCVSVSKKAAVSYLNGKDISVDDEIEKVLLLVWNNGNNHGIKTMDKMHKKVDKM